MISDREYKYLGKFCQIDPPKSEARKKLSHSDNVSFVPMSDLGEGSKHFEIKQERSFGDVIRSYTYFSENDVLLAKITPCFENGKLGIARNLTNGVGFGSSEYLVLRPSSELNPDYLYYFLSQDAVRQAGASVMLGAVGHKRVPKDFIENLLLYVPLLDEQKRIAAILDEAFAGIAAATANAEKNLANARELFESRLIALFDEGQNAWERKTLRQAALDFGRGKSKHRPRNDPKLYGGNYPFIQTGDVRNCDHVILESSQTYSDTGLAQSKLWPKGTICITIAANIAETGILGFEACFPHSVIGMVVDPEQTTNDFVEYLLRTVQSELKAAGKGSAQDNINLATFEDRFFPFPELGEQVRIVKTLNDLSVQVQRLEHNYTKTIKKLAELKQAILQKAFSGELTALPEKVLQEEAA